MLIDGPGGGSPSRHIELDIDIGADARDWSAIQAQEKLKPVETELRRIEELVGEIVSEMDYLRTREQKLRDTNESTNERVKWFAFGTMGMLVGLGAWQVVYLRAYFRYVSMATSCCGHEQTLNRSSQIEASDLGGVCSLYDRLPWVDYFTVCFLGVRFFSLQSCHAFQLSGSLSMGVPTRDKPSLTTSFHLSIRQCSGD